MNSSAADLDLSDRGPPAFGESGPESFGDRVGRAATAPIHFRWQLSEAPDEVLIALGGTFSIDEAAALWQRVSAALERRRRPARVRVDMSQVEAMDGTCLALLIHLRGEYTRRGVPCELAGGSAELQRLLELHGRRRLRRLRRPPISAVEQVGLSTVSVLRSLLSVLDFFGEFVLAAFSALKVPRTLNLRDVALTMERAGADAVPIVLLVNFLTGFVMAFQSGIQLQRFGANIFVADLVGLAMVRELGPLMTAIIACGRSGASFAAELGTMRVSEEVDALRTLGILPQRFLVLPRVLGLMLVAPALTLLADAIGIVGGVLVAAVKLDVTPAAFMTELRQVMEPWDVISGLIKSVVFSGALAVIACQRGLTTAGGAEGVGRQTTSAVVIGLFVLILLDAMFTVFFGTIGS
ncbi:MAG TPA: MlaE family lipid ABC transporter permease subunit [Polyangiaceae bacterium]|nr:MlaE family lipid ABC transporter permease subunit [Polyangiaceae bacterium]